MPNTAVSDYSMTTPSGIADIQQVPLVRKIHRSIADTDPFSNMQQILVEEAVTVAGLQLALKNQEGAPGKAISPPTMELSDPQRQFMADMLPRLSSLERRILVLTSCFKQSPEVVKSVLGCTVDEVGAALQNVDRLKYMPLTTGLVGKSGETIAKPDYEMILSTHPQQHVFWKNVEPGESRITDNIIICGLQFGQGKIAIATPPGKKTLARDKCGYLAALGLSNKQIGGVLYIAVDSVKAHLGRLFTKRNVTNRTSLVGSYVADGTFDVAPSTTFLELSPAEALVAKYAGEGMTNAAIGRKLRLTEVTVRSCLRQIFRRNDFTRRSQLALAITLQNASTQKSDAESI